jgi:hypothetical protein
MSISLEEARKKLDILERLANNPELILTELYTEGVSGSNFLYQINVNGKYILDYLQNYLSTLPVFSDCKVSEAAWELKVKVDPLRIGEYTDYISDDEIIKIDLDKHTYKIIHKNIKAYEKIMNEKYELEVKELDHFFKQFMNLTLKKRISNSCKSLISKKKLKFKLYDSVMWYFISNKKIKAKLAEEIESIDNWNAYNKKEYDEKVEQQKYYLQYAPNHINNIKHKQKEISDYLLSIGYKEDKEMSDY